MNQPNFDWEILRNNQQAAGLLKNREVLQSLLHSPDLHRIRELLRQNTGEALEKAARQGDTAALKHMAQQLIQDEEAARLIRRIQQTAAGSNP